MYIYIHPSCGRRLGEQGARSAKSSAAVGHRQYVLEKLRAPASARPGHHGELFTNATLNADTPERRAKVIIQTIKNPLYPAAGDIHHLLFPYSSPSP